MAVAAYASVVSLMHVLDHIQHPFRHRLLPNMKQIETLREKVHFLQQFLELHSQGERDQIKFLVRRISEVANEAQVIIDSHVVDQLREEREEKIYMGLSLLFTEDANGVDQLHGESESTIDIGLSSFFCQEIDEVIEKIDYIKEELLTMVNEGKAVHEQQSRASVPVGTSALPSGGKNTVVGFDEHLVRIMDQLTGHQPNLQIIPIVGMGGIGKTTLARFAFENKYVVEHFHLRAWFTISQEYSIREILSGLLCGIGVVDYNADDLIEISELLYQNLSGRKYLIVIDDMWSTEVWDDLRLFFPDNRNASRIMVTTRLSNVADCLSSRNPYFMNFLDEDKSWNLFSEKAFARESCSPELEKLGKKIVKSCRGLPLAIVVIGGCLSKSNMTREVWEFVAENASSYTNSENDEQCLKILALSYHHLPIHLKPCFLYMRVFPEDHEIQVSKLIRLWISEGFLNSLRAKNLEDVAEEYLKDLIDRNLILIRNKGLTGKVKTCGIHDLLRDLCIRESHEEPFFCIPRVQQIDFKIRKETMCFLCSDGYIPERIRLREVILVSQSSSLVNPWVCNACRTMYPHLIRLRFVIVMIQKDGMPIQGFPQPTTLQYFTTNYVRRLNISSFSSLPLLWNLHTLIINGAKQIVLPFEIWEMPQLRHIKIKSVVLPDPIDNQIEGKDSTILENLNYLSRVVNVRFTEEILKKLRIYFNNFREDWSYYSLDNLARLSKLESLYLIAESFSLKIIAFPHSLKKLSLSLCRMSWEDMTIIGSLPNLEVLKLGIDAFEGPEWNPIEGEFLRLKFLSIACIDLKCWRAEDIHFSSLECLELLHMRGLKKIPSGIQEIATLHSIHLCSCVDTLIDSAKEIIEEQRSMGNEDLQLHISPC